MRPRRASLWRFAGMVTVYKCRSLCSSSAWTHANGTSCSCIKDQKRGPISRGVEGVSVHLPGVIRFIRSRTSLAPYKRVMTLGTSAGGYAAILAALLMHAARGISICGLPPQAPLGFWLRWKLRQASAGDKPELEFVHGADSERDHATSLSLLSSFGGRVRSIAGVGDHNVLFALLKRGQLAEFLREVLT